MESIWYLTKEDAEKTIEYFKSNPVKYSVQGEVKESVSTEGKVIYGFNYKTWSLD